MHQHCQVPAPSLLSLCHCCFAYVIISGDVASWSISDVEDWMIKTKFHSDIKAALTGATGEELLLLSDGEIFDSLGLSKFQAKILGGALNKLGVVVVNRK